MKTQNVRWKCDVCSDGLLAPSRPRKNDVRRYCLPCSVDAGVLVERTAPALEKKRAAKKVTTSKKQASKRATVSRKNAPAKEQARIDAKRKTMITKEALTIWKLMQPYHKGKRLPTINIVRARNWGSQNGHASGSFGSFRSIQVNVDLDQDILRSKRVWAVLAHELAHCAVPPKQRAGRGRDTHSKEFYHCLRLVWQKRWKCSISFFEVSTWGYSVDHIIQDQASRHIDWLLPTREIVKMKETASAACEPWPSSASIEGGN